MFLCVYRRTTSANDDDDDEDRGHDFQLPTYKYKLHKQSFVCLDF